MTWVAVAIAGSAVLGGVSANKSAKAAEKGNKQGIASQEKMLERMIQLQQPNINLGGQATQRLSQLMFGNNNQPPGQTPGINPNAMIDPRMLGGKNGFIR